VARPEAVLLDAAEGGPEAVAAALRAIFEAASGQVDRVYVVPPAPGVALPAPFARRVEDADARAFVDAARQAGEAAGVRVVLGEEATAAAGASCRPEAVLAARIRAAQPVRPSS
jgi:catechol 2,3-dioxygenase-like lactoylglutathione lyase family enzyme